MESGTRRMWRGFLITHGEFDIILRNNQVLVTKYIPAISMTGYPNYKLYFTSWALGRYNNVYLPMLKEMDSYN